VIFTYPRAFFGESLRPTVTEVTNLSMTGQKERCFFLPHAKGQQDQKAFPFNYFRKLMKTLALQ
jgi:hypothetical protein